MPFSFVVNGVTYTQDNFYGQAYADESTGWPAAMADMLAHVAGAFKGTSTSSLTVNTGSKAFTLATPVPAFGKGMPVRIARTSAPTTTYMSGEVTAFDGLGAITVNVVAVVGSGTHSDWTVTVGGTTTTAATPVSINDGGTGASTGSVGLGNLTAAISKVVTTENTPAVNGVALYVLGDDPYPQWVDAVTGISSVMAVLNRVDGSQDEVEIYDMMADGVPRVTQANIGGTGITVVSKHQAGGRFAVGADDGVHVMEFQAGGLVEIANEFTTLTPDGIAVGYREDPPFNHATGGRIPVVAVMMTTDASPVRVIMEDGRTFTRSNPAGGGIAILDGRLFYAAGGTDVWFVRLDTIVGDNWSTEREIFGDTTASNPAIGADNAMDAGGGMIVMADSGGLSFAKNFHGPHARNSVTSYEVWAVCQIDTVVNSGWSIGESRAIWLANSTTDDFSSNSNTLTETGTVTESAVATGAELNGYSGWSASNYLALTASADFAFGTAPDTVVMLKFWLQLDSAAIGTQTILDMQDGVGAADNILVEWIAGTGLRVTLDPETGGTLTVDSDQLAADDTWYQVGFGFDSVEGQMRLFINGVEMARTAVTASTHNGLGQADTDVRIGITHAGSNALTDGILALFHVGASRPDGDWGEFFKFAYETEKRLFLTNANCLLNGAGDAVLDVSWDPASQKTLAMQSDVINEFTGLERTTDDATPGGWTGTVNKGVAIRTNKGLQTVLTASDEELYVERANYALVDMSPLAASQMALAAMLGEASKANALTAYSRPQYHPYSTLTDGATIDWDLLTQPNAIVTLGGNRTMAAPNNIVAGAVYAVTVVQDGTGSRTLSWNSAYKFPGGTAPTLTTAANAVDKFTFQGRRSGNDLILEQPNQQDVK